MRQLIRPPQLRTGQEDRKSTWTELFYDLAFVVAVAFLGHEVSKDVSFQSLLEFFVLFTPLWWAWAGFTFFANRFDTDDVLQRVSTLAQIIGVVFLSIFLHDGLSYNFVGFAIAYICIRILIILSYARVVFSGEERAHKAATWYVIGFTIALLPWVLAALVDGPMRLVLVSIALFIDIFTPISSYFAGKYLPLDPKHIQERFGLFTIIVLAETLAGIVRAGNEVVIDSSKVLSIGLGVTIAFLFWWIYFENLDDVVFKKTNFTTQLWIVVHLPLTMALILMGVGLEKSIMAVGQNGNAIIGSEFLFFTWSASMFCWSFIEFLTTFEGESNWAERLIIILRFILGFILIGLAFTPIVENAILSMSIVVAMGIIVIIADIAVKRLLCENYFREDADC